MSPQSTHHEQATRLEHADHLFERLGLVVEVVQHVDHHHAVGLVVVDGHHVVAGLDDAQPALELRGDLRAQHLDELRQRLDGEDLAVRHGLRHGDRVDAGAGAVVDHGLGAVQLQQLDDRRLRQRLEPRGVLEVLPVLVVELVGHVRPPRR